MSDLVERCPKEAAMLREIAQSYSRGVDWQAYLSASAAVIDLAAARITELETALAEAEGRVIAEVVAWLRDENGQCDCFARSEGECACGAWDDYKTKPLLDIATALETGEWKK